MMQKKKAAILITFLVCFFCLKTTKAVDFADNSFLIAKATPSEFQSNHFWTFLQKNEWTGIELDLDSLEDNIFIRNSRIPFSSVLEKLENLISEKESQITPVFINFSGNVKLLDSIIESSPISSQLFYLPQGEKWPTNEYLVQSNRRIIFFVEGNTENQSQILHHTKNYTLQISANQITPNSVILSNESNISKELFEIKNFNRLPTGGAPGLSRRMVPDYINFLLESWTKYGKKPNFIFMGTNIYDFDFIIEQLNSFNVIKGMVRTIGKNMERIYWNDPEILITGGKFSFPILGGDEMILSPFAPGYRMTPSQIIITGEMVMPEQYSIIAHPLNLNEGLKASFHFDGSITDNVNPKRTFTGNGYSFSQDIDRGSVLRLPENANVNLGDPNLYSLPNSSFTVSCFVKFTDILEYGDNAILGNNESGYRRAMHLILRSGHPYFGLWANDYISDEILEDNTWYHLTWRYIIETGQQAIFVNGKYVGGSEGHPPYSGSSDLHLGSALSGGASLRGYIDNLYIWNRPLGGEEINRLALDEEIQYITEPSKSIITNKNTVLILSAVLVAFVIFFLLTLRKISFKKKQISVQEVTLPQKNRIQFFGEFTAINNNEEDVSELFTPKVKELLVFTVINNLQNRTGAPIQNINETLWFGIEPKKVANNRAVTLNKLRKILVQFENIEIISNSGYLQLKTAEPFFCDFMEAFKLCQLPEGMSRQQLELFFHLVKKGRFLKDAEWIWLDDIRGFTGNQVIDNLLKLASIYKKENRQKEVEKVARRILEYDDLNEEAIFLQIWGLQKDNNSHMAKFNFESFCTKYKKSMGEPYKMGFNEFTHYYSELL